MNSASSASASERLGRAARRCRAALSVFALAIAAAASLYPGGSWTEPGAAGFSPLRNFWCDLVRTQAINGADNSASRRLSCVAFAALACALWWFWPIAGALLPPGRGALLQVLGRISTLALFAMALLPSDAHPVWHGVVALAGGGLGMTCAALCCIRCPAEPRYSLRRASAYAALLLAALNAALYIYVAYVHGPETPLQPGVQKLATLALVLWMAVTVRRALAERDLSGAAAR
ncbi:MAG TPA: hypothetical protein VFS67_13630 [Polyangiaceae bacterium]|nr:hypothetical protein [Polyangiaceae bacterium]